MRIRKRLLPEGWYPSDANTAAQELAGFERPSNHNASAVTCLVPHASWYFSGGIAFRAIQQLRHDVDCVLVFGGHLGDEAPPLFVESDAFETPFGPLFRQEKLLSALKDQIELRSDSSADNTIEVLLPMVRHAFPTALFLGLRMPAVFTSWEIGRIIARTAHSLGLACVAISSSDLTHYGPNYGFEPQGGGIQALDWVRSVNDRRFLEAVIEGDPKKTLKYALEDQSACSPGAVLAGMGFANESGAYKASLIEYGTSADIRPSASFVGYGSISWEL